jgi:DNA-binding NarL/FixJ family response regulator
MGLKGKKVLIVDTHPLVLGLTKDLLQNNGFEVRAASSASEAKQIFSAFKPEVCVTDVELEPNATGVDLANSLRLQNLNLHLVFLTALPDFRPLGVPRESIPGRFAYLNRGLMTDPKRLIHAIDAGGNAKALAAFRDDKLEHSELSSVSRIQLEALRLVALGFTNQEIADHRNVTLRAVEALLNRAASALNIDGERGSNPRVKLARAFIREAGLPL